MKYFIRDQFGIIYADSKSQEKFDEFLSRCKNLKQVCEIMSITDLIIWRNYDKVMGILRYVDHEIKFKEL